MRVVEGGMLLSRCCRVALSVVLEMHESHLCRVASEGCMNEITNLKFVTAHSSQTRLP